ncbi:plasmid replication protein RepC [Arvimicrobium flavum]|uniref:plasmid replication protein RepC n=1 Tax=Arvimicrobium flavum TaxID=3393320 RepID=UPI00237C0ADE|nr:plasmid replication protein RepC [Mesorhizobium shangrilense]
MTERFATTPFGGGRISASFFRMREEVERKRTALREGRAGTNDTGKADKWRLLRALTEARDAYGLSDRSIVVLEALASCWPEKEIDGAAEVIVFPSNAELSLRSRGMAPATIRRHLAALVAAGMILRRDSANGKRYCRRDDRGQVETAFGFDLAPFAQAAAEIFAAADAARAEAQAMIRLRGEITIHQRDIAKVIEAAIDEERAGDWFGFAERLAMCGGRLPRVAPRLFLERRREDMVRLRAEVETAYLDALAEQEMSANDSDSERHIQNSNTDLHFERGSENELKRTAATTGRPRDGVEGAAGAEPSDGGEEPAGETDEGRRLETKAAPITLERLKSACPGFEPYARDGLGGWREVIATAGLVRSILGVSPDAWSRARKAMGDVAAAVTIAAILERVDEIRSPGGYLRALTLRAEDGKFSVLPMIQALENR